MGPYFEVGGLEAHTRDHKIYCGSSLKLPSPLLLASHPWGDVKGAVRASPTLNGLSAEFPGLSQSCTVVTTSAHILSTSG